MLQNEKKKTEARTNALIMQCQQLCCYFEDDGIIHEMEIFLI